MAQDGPTRAPKRPTLGFLPFQTVPSARLLSQKVRGTRWARTVTGFGTVLARFGPCLVLSRPQGAKWGHFEQPTGHRRAPMGSSGPKPCGFDGLMQGYLPPDLGFHLQPQTGHTASGSTLGPLACLLTVCCLPKMGVHLWNLSRPAVLVPSCLDYNEGPWEVWGPIGGSRALS